MLSINKLVFSQATPNMIPLMVIPDLYSMINWWLTLNYMISSMIGLWQPSGVQYHT